MKLPWTSIAPPAAAALVPPVPGCNDSYILDHDAASGNVVYACRLDDDKQLAAWTYDGQWRRLTAEDAVLHAFNKDVEGGGVDPSRNALVAWCFSSSKQQPVGAAIDLATGALAQLPTSGDPPVDRAGDRKPDMFEKRGVFTYDQKRDVWVCVTRAGIWELDGEGVWAKRHGEDGIPAAWKDHSGQGVYDDIEERTVFMFWDGDAVHIAAWDGQALAALPTEGLGELVSSWNFAARLFTDETGLCVMCGETESQVYGLNGDDWAELAIGEDPPRALQSAIAVYQPSRKALVLGPGKHEDSDADYEDVFYERHRNAWRRGGAGKSRSPLKSAGYGQVRTAHVAGEWLATGISDLQTWRWTGAEWQELVDSKTADEIGETTSRNLVVAGDKLYSVTSTGAVYEWTRATWQPLVEESALFKERKGAHVAADASGRIVSWGGVIKNRKQNDTLVLEGGAWRAVKKASRLPVDFKPTRSAVPEFHVAFDAALGALVRFGHQDVAVLGAGDVWTASSPPEYTALVQDRAWTHVPVHDAESGETLLLDLAANRVVRFDLGGCAQVAEIQHPEGLEWSAFINTYSFDPTTKSLYAQWLEDARGTWRLDLSAAFAAAKQLGARTIPARDPAAALEPDPQIVYQIDGDALAASDVPRDGFVPPDQLPSEELARFVCAPSCAIAMSHGDGEDDEDDGEDGEDGDENGDGKDRDEADGDGDGNGDGDGDGDSAAPSASRFGGMPSIAAAQWPTRRGKPMGFVFQIETGDRFPGHAGVAMFCALDGDAANEAEENEVVWVDDFAQSCAAPDGVELQPVHALAIAGAKLELDEDKAAELGARDPELAAAIDAAAAGDDMQKPHLYSKLGGFPAFAQGNQTPDGHVLVAQLDLDMLPLNDVWPDAELAGIAYVFATPDGTAAVAFWQYT